MNNLTEFLRDGNARISLGDKWMCVSGIGEDIMYTVYQRKYRARKTTKLYMGVYLSIALAFLNGELV